MAWHSHNLLSCTKHRICVLRSSKEVILCCYDLMDYRFVSLLLLLSLFPFRIGRGPNVSLLVVGPEKRPGL